MRVLFLTHRLPYVPNRGDRVRAFHVLRHIRNWADVDLVSLAHDDEEASHATEAKSLASSVSIIRLPRSRNMVRSFLSLPGSRPTTHTMLDAPDVRATIERVVRAHAPSVVLAYCSGVARFALEPPLDRFPLVLDMVDVDSAKWAALAETASPPRSWIYAREARLLGRFERVASCRATATLVATTKERDSLLAIAPEARVEVIQNGVDAERLRPTNPPSASPVLVFCGVMNYPPNEEAAMWMAREVWPRVRVRWPEARLEFVGSSPTQSVLALSQAGTGIVVTGSVPDVREYLWRGAVGIAPLLTARGIQNKVLEAVGAGLPTVVTPVVWEGLPAEVRPACTVADGAEAFATAIIALLGRTPDERRAIANRADLAALSWERRLAGLGQILREAAADRRSASQAST